MSRMTMTLDSATADEMRAFVLAFQATADLGGVSTFDNTPTVKVMGAAWTVATPPMSPARYRAMAAHLLDTAGTE